MTDDAVPPGRAWARSKLDWLDQVADDLEADHLTFRVAHAIARAADKDSGIADRPQAHFAERVKATVRSVQLSVDRLIARGHLVKLPKANARLGTRYRPVLRTDVSHTKPVSHEGGVQANCASHESADQAKYASHETGFQAKSDAISSEAQFAPIPVRTPRLDSSPSARTVPATTKTNTASRISDADLLARLRQAADGKVEDGPGIQNVQPVRALMAEGADLDRHILFTVAIKVAALRSPLGRWSAPFLVDAIRAAMKASPISAAASGLAGESSMIRGVTVPNDRILRRVRDYLESGVWPDDVRDRWGPAPGEFGCCIPPALCGWSPAEGPMPTVRIPGNDTVPEANIWAAVARWRRGAPWHIPFGPEPDHPDCWLPTRFRQPPRTPSAPRLSSPERTP